MLRGLRSPNGGPSVSSLGPRLVFSLALTLVALVAVALLSMSAASADGPFTLTILHTNDTHARIESFTEGGVLQGGVARRYTAIQQVKAEGGNVLLVDAGDAFQGTLFFNYWQGQEAAYFMNALGYQAMAIGNHEFDSGPPALARFIDAANFPVLSANIDASAEISLTGKIQPYTVIEVGGQQIGVFGLTTPDTAFISSPGPNVQFTDPVAAAQSTVAALQALGVNKIVALTHLGYLLDQALAAAVSGVDVIVGGHSHTPLGPMPGAQGPYPTVVMSPAGEPVLIVSAWEWGRYLGRLNVTFDANGVVQAFQGAPIFINAAIPEDPTIAAAVAEFRQPVDALANTVVGSTQVLLDGARANVRSRETNLGNLICDAMLWKTASVGTQICIQNGGGIRASLNPGNITIGGVLTVLPFGNQISTFGLRGRDVIAALENGVSRVEFGDGRFPQVGGIRYAWDPQRPAGRRIVSVEVKNPDGTFSPLDPNRVYMVTSNDFMRRGGDAYFVFRDNAINPYDSWAVLADAVVEYLQAPESAGGLGGTVMASRYPLAGEGRILRKTATVNRARRYDVAMDTFIDGNRPGLNFGGLSTMWVGLNNTMRPVFKVDVPVCNNVHTCILPNAFIDRAYLYLYVQEGRGFADWAGSTMDVSVRPVNTTWGEDTATWTTPWTAAGGDFGAPLATARIGSGRIGTWLRFDITNYIWDVVLGRAENKGFLLTSNFNVALNKAVSPEGIASARYGFATGEGSDPSKVGYLRVIYRTYPD
ncbi:MAG: 5'-nucleotidase C-terminal domain-containing protein [Caldilineales bacterium]|nr:5'-nucleotidase C-terminal domain-containing protein [Caldilineales bacterium]MDW8317562.1 5'-nucleotidase C-terminal domain-containing protein [Anaerolineae bacterium]